METTLQQPADEHLTSQVISSSTWTMLGTIGQRGLSLLSTVLLARLLMPSAYGLLGMATVLIAAAESLDSLGTSSALIQRKQFSDKLASSLFWVNVLFGACVAFLIYASSPLVATVYHEPKVKPVLAVLSCAFFITCLGVVHRAILMRSFLFKRLAIIQLVSSLVSVSAALGLAVRGAGVWSLVAALIIQKTCLVVLYWITSSWRPRWHCNLAELRSVTTYSSNLTGANILKYFLRNSDNALIGRFLGAIQLGYYSVAYGLMMYPLYNVSFTLGNVLFPAFAQIQDDNTRFRRAYLRACAVIATLTFPLMLGAVVTADPLVAALFGPKWIPMVPIVMILAPVGMIESITSTFGIIFKAKGRTDWLFRWALVETTVALFSFVLGLRWGVTGVAGCYAIARVLLTYPAARIAFRLVDLPVAEFLGSLWLPLRNSLLMCGWIVVLRLGLNRAGLDEAWLRLIVMVITGALAYGALFIWSKTPVLQDVLEILYLGRKARAVNSVLSWLTPSRAIRTAEPPLSEGD